MADHNLSLVKPSPLEPCRAKSTADPFVVYPFYDIVKREMERLNLVDKPGNIFNLDETAFFIDPSRGKVVAGTGSGGTCRITSGPGRQCFSVMACISADGAAQPPLVIFPAKHLYSSWEGHDVIEGTTYDLGIGQWLDDNPHLHRLVQDFHPTRHATATPAHFRRPQNPSGYGFHPSGKAIRSHADQTAISHYKQTAAFGRRLFQTR